MSLSIDHGSLSSLQNGLKSPMTLLNIPSTLSD